MHRRVLPHTHNKWYDGHDRNREEEPAPRKVSFKYRPKGSRRQRGWDNKLKAALLDEDVEMLGHSQQFGGRHNKQFLRGLGRRGGQRMGRDFQAVIRSKQLQESPIHWYKVLVPKGSKYDKQYLYQVLLNYIKPTPLIPYGFARRGDDITFFVDNYETGKKLHMADKKITANDGWKLSLFVRPNFPNIIVDDALKEKLKIVMSKRYNVQSKALNLSKFHSDPDLMKEDLLVVLNRPNTLNDVMKIVAESIPDLQGLDLSDNKLSVVDPLKVLAEKTANLRILHLGNNMFRNLHFFDVLKPLPIEELVLDGNPLCDKFNHQDVYVREVRKRFPKIVNLDGVVLPREISFDLEETHKLKPSQGSFLCEARGGLVIRQFLEQYYSLYDSNARGPLIDAYREDALFSMTAISRNMNGLTAYSSESRNLIHNARAKNGLLRRGRASIIAFMESLPQTQHDPASFAVDLSFFSPKLIILSICGVFREVNSKLMIKAFSRAFIIVPSGSGYCIVNDLLHITLATSEQAKEAFKTEPEASTSTAPPTPAAPIPVANVLSPEAELSRRQQMVSALAMQSGMNIGWAEKCLNETNWDYDRAVFVFTELQKQGTIPPAAFIK